jgi:hypothetical protein
MIADVIALNHRQARSECYENQRIIPNSLWQTLSDDVVAWGILRAVDSESTWNQQIVPCENLIQSVLLQKTGIPVCLQ